MEQLGKILIVDDNEDVLFALNLLLEPYVEKIKVAITPDRIEYFMTTFQPDIILLDMNFSRDAISGQEGFDSLKQILSIDPQAVVIFMTAYADTDKAVKAIKAGATDFIPKPWEKEKLLAKNLFDYSRTIAKPLLETVDYPWEALPKISEFIIELGKTLDPEIYEQRGENVWVAKSAKVFDSAYLGGPLIICEDAEIRQCAFIRGNAIVGRGAVVGNSTELKNSILFDGVQTPHYNYIGDSILGYKSHTGAGVITSNLKSDKSLVTVLCDGDKVDTNVKKFGAMLGDHVEVGCNSVLNPGSVIGRNTNIYPLSFVRGYVPENSIYKRLGEVAEKYE